MGAKSGKSGKGSTRSAGVRRLWLVVFGVLLVGLFVGFAVAQGIGQPSVPSGDVALVQSVPDELGSVTQEDFDKALKQQLGQASLKKPPKPGSKKYEELKVTTMEEVLDSVWVRGQAEELDISATSKQIEDELDQIKEQNFPTEKAYKGFLKTSGFTQEDVDDRVELQILGKQIQEQVSSEAPPPSDSQVEETYESTKTTQFTAKPSRDVRLITNQDKGEVEAAKKALEADSSPANWKKVAPKYSEDTSTNKKGGLQENLSEEILPEPLKKQIFGAATGEIIGPLKFSGSYTIVEVVKLNPEKVQSLNEVRPQIESQLTQQVQQEFFSEFVSDYQSRWKSRTFCASGYKIERCANFVGTGHPSNAAAACYEADPKVPVTECPAPVAQLAPALPGSTTVLKPQGERLPQRPRPLAAPKPDGKGGAPAPEGAAPPPGTAEEPPTSE
ncbi:MAG TPA: peptidyl-prolyl cis-trans isomerase [Solirubrobacterales bacterium]|nr:peptidyl-prolyl cis-trans isomerase [Solirubrobacterales bacterium]